MGARVGGDRGRRAPEGDEHRRAALDALRLRSVASVVGSHAVPFRFFAVSLVTPVVAVALLVAAFRREEALLPDLMALLLVSVVGCGLEFRRMVRFYLERRGVVNASVAGGREVPGPRLEVLKTMEGGVRTEFLATLGLSAGLNVALVGGGLLYRDSEATLGPLLILVGPSIAWLAFSWVRAWGRQV